MKTYDTTKLTPAERVESIHERNGGHQEKEAERVIKELNQDSYTEKHTRKKGNVVSKVAAGDQSAYSKGWNKIFEKK